MSLNFTDSDISDDVWYWNLKKKKLIPEQFQICSLKFCKTSSALLRDCNMKNAAVVCSKVGISENFYSSSVRKMRSNCAMKINSVRIYQWWITIHATTNSEYASTYYGMQLGNYLELVYLVTALVPSDTACLASSPGKSSLTAVWISREVMVDLQDEYINCLHQIQIHLLL